MVFSSSNPACPGLHNRNAGPDFFNAKIKINGTLWVGNVEIHDKASDWYLHAHDKDERYDNVILHVCGTIDTEARNSKGALLVQMQLDIPDHVLKHYQELLTIDQYPPCYQIIPSLSKLTVHSWMSALQTERLSQKTEAIEERVRRCNGDWENAYFVTLARNYGFGINGDAFEQWALKLPLRAVDHHRDDLFQIEAIFMGQAGLLELNTIPERYQKDALNDGYFARLRNEYLYLSHKFSLQPMDYKLWRFLRLRPQNFPHIRISQLANLYYNRRAGLSQLLEASTVKEAKKVLATSVTGYWETHYTFGSTSIRNEKHLSPFSLNLLIINTVNLNAHRALLIAYRKLADSTLDASHQGFCRYELSINHGSSESLAEHAKANIRYVFHRSEEEGLRPKFYITYFHLNLSVLFLRLQSYIFFLR
jgi:hypothetical protein